jgi:hypothetical protein
MLGTLVNAVIRKGDLRVDEDFPKTGVTCRCLSPAIADAGETQEISGIVGIIPRIRTVTIVDMIENIQEQLGGNAMNRSLIVSQRLSHLGEANWGK